MKRTLIVIPAALQAQANAKAKEVDTAAGENTFTVGLSSSGAAPATHYWCSWQMTDEDFVRVSQRLDTPSMRTAGVKMYDGDATDPEQVLTTLGLKRVEASA